MRHRMPVVALVAVLTTATSVPATDEPPLHDDTPEVPAGTYLVDVEWFGAAFLITMPDGWTADTDFVTWGPHASYVAWRTPTAVPPDSCSWEQPPMTPVATAAELAAAMGSQERSLVGEPRPLTIGGATGVQFTVAPDPFLGVECDTGRQVVWRDAADDVRWFHGAHDTFTVWALDLPVGLRAFTIGAAAPLLPHEHRQLLDIADSIVFPD